MEARRSHPASVQPVDVANDRGSDNRGVGLPVAPRTRKQEPILVLEPATPLGEPPTLPIPQEDGTVVVPDSDSDDCRAISLLSYESGRARAPDDLEASLLHDDEALFNHRGKDISRRM